MANPVLAEVSRRLRERVERMKEPLQFDQGSFGRQGEFLGGMTPQFRRMYSIKPDEERWKYLAYMTWTELQGALTWERQGTEAAAKRERGEREPRDPDDESLPDDEVFAEHFAFLLGLELAAAVLRSDMEGTTRTVREVLGVSEESTITSKAP
jgi:hypothetical protein